MQVGCGVSLWVELSRSVRVLAEVVACAKGSPRQGMGPLHRLVTDMDAIWGWVGEGGVEVWIEVQVGCGRHLRKEGGGRKGV